MRNSAGNITAIDARVLPASGAVAMRRMGSDAIFVTAMTIGRALIAHVRLAFIGTILLACFYFAGTGDVLAFHSPGLVTLSCKLVAIP